MVWGRSATTPPSAPEANEGEYGSALFAEFVAGVARLGPEAEVLDLGMTTPANIHYWATRGHRVAVIDILSKGETDIAGLGLAGRRFGGICCWNVLDYAPRPLATSWVSGLISLLVPGGMLFAIFDGDGRAISPRQRYRVIGDGKLRIEPWNCELQNRALPTNEVELLLRDLKPTRLTVMRHGSREALGMKPRPAARL